MSNENNRIYVDPNFMPQGPVKRNLKLIPFILGLVFLTVYAIFSFALIKANITYFKTYEGQMNFFRFVSWALSGLAGFYVIGCWLLSIVNVILFASCGQSESNLIYYFSRALLLLSVFCFIIPIIVITIVV